MKRNTPRNICQSPDPAELGPETRCNGSGSNNGAERTQNEPRRPSIRPVRGEFLV